MPILLLLGACQDYQVVTGRDKVPPEEEALDTPTPETSTADAEPVVEGSFRANWQMNTWGAQLGRCDVAFAFYIRDDEPVTAGQSGQVLADPDVDGACRLTRFDPSEEVASASMTPLGTMDAGETLTLEDDDFAVSLVRSTNDLGQVEYAIDDCAQQYPFGRSLDLVSAGSVQEGGIPAFTIEDALAVGPDIVPVSPAVEDLEEDGSLSWSNKDPLPIQWAYAGEPPLGPDGPVYPSAQILVRNTYRSDGSGYVNGLFEALKCRVKNDGQFRIPADVLQLLTPTDEAHSIYTSVQTDVWWEAGASDAPWGTLANNTSLTSWGGTMYLTE